jgi:outer membrane protein
MSSVGVDGKSTGQSPGKIRKSKQTGNRERKIAVLLFVFFAALASAQELTITQVVKMALESYPQTRINEEQVKAAAAGVQLARLAYLPKADAIAQVNRATRNNVYGMVLQQQVISPISGPPLAANAGTNVWGTALGFLVAWEPFDFGLRRATVSVSESSQRKAEASLKRTRFEVAAMAADSYLTLLASEQALETSLAGRERLVTMERIVRSLVDSGLRPGMDLSRTQAERAAIENQIIQSRAAVEIARTGLAQFLNQPPEGLKIARQHFLEPSALLDQNADLKSHPAAVEQGFAQQESQARLKVLERSYYPKFNTQATMYARGTGANPDFTTGGALSGLGPNIYNWGIGFTMTYSLMDLPGLRIRKEIESARGRAEQARYDQLVRDLSTQRLKAQTQVKTALELARNTPVQWKAAKDLRAQAEARYQAGLIPILEVADAERTLIVAEIDDRLARLGIWRAQLGLAIAQGDITEFLAEAEKP